MQQKHITYEGSTVFYKTSGKGLPVVLLHGFAEDSHIWDNQCLFFKDQYSLIIPDIPGSGQSAPLKKENIDLADYAACIKNILSEENIDRCIMIGHSMGGYITLAFAEKYPDELIAVGLFHSSAFADDREKIDMRKKAIAFIKANGAASFLKTSIPGLFYDLEKSKTDIESLLRKGNNFNPETLIQYYKAMISRPDRTAVFKDTCLPVLFIAGEHDKAVPFYHSLAQSHIPQLSYIYVLRNAAHMGMLEETARSNKILAEFLQSQVVK